MSFVLYISKSDPNDLVVVASDIENKYLNDLRDKDEEAFLDLLENFIRYQGANYFSSYPDYDDEMQYQIIGFAS